MKVIRSKAAMQRLAGRLRCEGRVGFVPTMGYLHVGHLSLVRRARERCDSVVASVFVNPTQFGPGEDLAGYPRNFARDCALMRQEGVDFVFHPEAGSMYPGGFATSVQVERLTRGLCGRSRPGHFRGVTTVVAKLLNIIRPHEAVFGRKDAQQAFVIRRMVRDLDFDTRIVLVPTAREPDGLAMSSRNVYLTEEQRRQAPVLYRSLQLARRMVRDGEPDPARVRRAIRRMIRRESDARIDYVEIVETEGLMPVRKIQGQVLVAGAVFLGRARLIDNVILRA